MNVPIKIKLLREDAYLPQRMTSGAAGFDIYSPRDGSFYFHQKAWVELGFAMEIPRGWYATFAPRSSLGIKRDVYPFPGIIDSDYRGEVVCVLGLSRRGYYQFSRGDRIAQMLILPAPEVEIQLVTELSETDRGSGGYGSTGR